MTSKFMAYPAGGQVAFFEEDGTTGTWDDPLAARNAPLVDPASHLPKIKFHSDLDHFEVLVAGSTTVSHAQVNAASTLVGYAVAYGTNAGGDDNLLYDFSSLGLSYVPRALVIVGTAVLFPGMPVQIGSNGAARYACAYIDTSTLRVATKATVGSSNLPAQDITYQFLIFKDPPAATGSTLFDFDPATGIITMGFGKFSSDRAYLQVQPGSDFSISYGGRTIDLNNGAPKAFNPDGSTLAPVPSSLHSYLPFYTATNIDLGGETGGASLGYGGSATAPATVNVSAP